MQSNIDPIVNITKRARAVLALSEELEAIEREIGAENERHGDRIKSLIVRWRSVEQAIYKLGVV